MAVHHNVLSSRGNDPHFCIIKPYQTMYLLKNLLERPLTIIILLIVLSVGIFDFMQSRVETDHAIRKSSVTGNVVVRQSMDLRNVMRQFQFFSKATETYVAGPSAY